MHVPWRRPQHCGRNVGNEDFDEKITWLELRKLIIMNTSQRMEPLKYSHHSRRNVYRSTVNINKPQHIYAMLIITSQYDHGSYLCMGINNFLSLQESWHLPPPPFASRGRLSRVWPARLLLPAFLLFLSLSFSPFSHFTHLQPDELLTEMEYQAQLPSRRNVAPRR